MLAKRITSLQHPILKHWIELRKNRAYRLEAQGVLITGEKAIREFPYPIKSLIILEPSSLQAEETFLVSEEILKKITGVEQPDGFAAEVALPPPQDLTEKKSLLILDQIQDPGNLGTLLRSALAFSWEGVVATPGTVDFFNDKALRAAQGATFLLPYAWQSPEEITNWIERKKGALWVADLAGTPLQEAAPKPPMALLLSSEGQGARPWCERIGQKISIPIHKRVESLNVAAAGAILLYSMRPSR